MTLAIDRTKHKPRGPNAMGHLGIAVAVAAMLASSRVASAAPCPVDPAIGTSSAALRARDAGERSAFLGARIDLAARRSRIWAASWGAGLGVLTIGQLAITPAVAAEDRPDFWVGAAASGIGALSRAVFLPVVLRERRRLRRLRDGGTGGCALLTAQERALALAAKGERQGRALWMHGLSLVFNAGVGLVLGLVFDRPVAGNRLASLGAVIGEVMIVTQPTLMMRTLDTYRRGSLSEPAGLRVRPLVWRGGGGVGIVGRIQPPKYVRSGAQ